MRCHFIGRQLSNESLDRHFRESSLANVRLDVHQVVGLQRSV